MKKRLFPAAALCILLLFPAAFPAGAFLIPCQYNETFTGELKYKYDRLRELPGKRIILVGGSAAAFGVDSGLLEDAFEGYTAVNFGMYAALGTKVMLDLCEPHLHEGDLVILMPEQNSQTLSLYFDGSAAWQAFDGAFGMLRHIRPENFGSLIQALPSFSLEKLRAYLSGSPIRPDSIYRRASFDEYGDILDGLCTENILPALYDQSLEVSFDESLMTDSFSACLNRFAARAEKKGARVWYHFCPVNRLSIVDGSDPEIFYAALQKKLTFPVSGDPRDCLMEEGWFYDTNFHLNAAGRQAFTTLLIRDIKAMQLDTSPTDIPALPMPVPRFTFDPDTLKNAIPQVSADGTFEYIAMDDQAVLTRYLPEGDPNGPAEILVPESFGGLPLTIVSSGAFSGNKMLRRIILPLSIRCIENDAFDGCSRLREIVLSSPSPSACVVGNGLLTGTDADLAVPGEALSGYRTDYRFSAYAERIVGSSS
ncbi:MAG: hypothetical protein IKE03_10555, partial [Blautia sp.]|nr:hypothetical protein [Blautia sp.]